MQILTSRSQLKAWRDEHRQIVLVPTMGNLHAGHAALIEHAKSKQCPVVVSIFVNPTQFDDPDDLARYPRTFDQDCDYLRSLGVDAVFAPDTDLLYPEGTEDSLRIDVGSIAHRFEGAIRPGHFSGVASVVARLFLLVKPDYAVFGEKDYQQCRVIERLVQALSLPVALEYVETVREKSGLALSSRNRFLSTKARNTAPVLYQILKRAAAQLRQQQPVEAVLAESQQRLEQVGFDVDYFTYVDADTLEPSHLPLAHGRILAAARLGSVRLLDNHPV
ncbi:MAG TPA: pantoate--beta-alanine ligase [Halothiobacillaceae bacterium]|nr:pantoate--beta-alanine ligase [Halothiobacillaceae bacterium]